MTSLIIGGESDVILGFYLSILGDVGGLKWHTTLSFEVHLRLISKFSKYVNTDEQEQLEI